jgi:excisionase family DNA binding protein
MDTIDIHSISILYSNIEQRGNTAMGQKQLPPYTIPQAAEVIGLPVQSTYRLAREGKLPGVIRIGVRMFIQRRALDELVDGSTGQQQQGA